MDTIQRSGNDRNTRHFVNQRIVTVAEARETVGNQVVQQMRIQGFNCKKFRHKAKECRKPKRVKDYAYHKEKMLLCKQTEKGVPLSADQGDWLDDTDEDEQVGLAGDLGSTNDILIPLEGSYGLKDLNPYSIGTKLLDDALPLKEKDPRSFTLPCIINNLCFYKSLADLGASVSVMPFSTYTKLGLGELAPTKLIVELADRTVKRPKDFAVVKNIDAYRDDGMGDVIVRRPFFKEACVKARRFNGMITLYKVDDSVTYQMARSHSRFKHLTNAQCNKMRPLLKVSAQDELKGLNMAYPSFRIRRIDFLYSFSVLFLFSNRRIPEIELHCEQVRLTGDLGSTNDVVIPLEHTDQPKNMNDTSLMETDDCNTIPDSSNVCNNDFKDDQNADDQEDERAKENAYAFEYALKKEVFEDLEYVQSLKKELNELPSEVIHKTSVSMPHLRSNQMKAKVMQNNSQVKIKLKDVEDHPRIYNISNKTKSVTTCNDSLNSTTSNVNVVCVACGKCMFNSNHDACVSKFLNDVNARSKKPQEVPIRTRKPIRNANQSVATSSKKTVASESTIQKSSSYFRMLNENTIRFDNDQFALILGYGDLVQGNTTIKRSTFKIKTGPISKGLLNLLYMDLYGPMRIENINGKKYILVIVDDYSRYTWTHFMRSKDETPEKILKTRTLYSLKEIDLESAQNNDVTKFPLLKQGDYEMWKLRIEQYFQVQDYALWDVIENGNSFNPVPRITENANVTSALTISSPITTKEKAQKKNDVKARSMLQKIVSQLAILGENIFQEDLNMKFLRSLPTKWNTHVVVWRNKADLDTMSIDDLYNNFKIFEQEVKRTVVSSSSSGSLNMAFLSSPDSTNEDDTASIQVYAASTLVSTVSAHDNSANLSKKITINGSDTAGYDKTNVECFNCHKMGHFARECRSPRSQESRPRNQDSSRQTVIVEDTSSKAMVAIDGAGNKSFLSDYQKYDEGFVAFVSSLKGVKITGKGKIRTGKLDFEDVYFVKKPKFNLFSVSQMCDKKNSVLFTETECLILSPNFKLPDENQVLLKATNDKSNLWHGRLGHINFKTINKLVKGNLVRGLPSKIFENDYTFVACQKGKQHKASSKMDETSEILKDFITRIENQLNHKVKITRCDNRTKFKNYEMNQFCGIKGIKREFGNARTPQQNGVIERKNRTLIEATRTMLADSPLPIPFWAEAVNTACYVQNRLLVTKPHNKKPYELLIGRAPIISFMRPFGCQVTILNTLNHLG
uniref:Uncharacterized protein n=1 Tax=Tanacetum cinerariifolium TaxID=118510 RepID=A0A6L2JC58_TANCI|nr:hypothetical protein [Tanacetum cinerariifolium]